jgi:hypothetical protein
MVDVRPRHGMHDVRGCFSGCEVRKGFNYRRFACVNALIPQQHAAAGIAIGDKTEWARSKVVERWLEMGVPSAVSRDAGNGETAPPVRRTFVEKMRVGRCAVLSRKLRSD